MDKSDHVKNALDVFQTIVRGNVPPGSEDFLRHMCVTAIDWHFKRQAEELSRLETRLHALEYPADGLPSELKYADKTRDTLSNIIRGLEIIRDRMPR